MRKIFIFSFVCWTIPGTVISQTNCSSCNPATTAECGISRHNTNGFLCVCNGTAAGDLCDSTLLIFGPFERFNNESGRITSVNYPDASPNRIRSLYIVQILEARYIELEFEFFCTEKHKDRLYYGIGSPPLPNDLSGQHFLSGCPVDGTLPGNIRLESDTIWLQYGTDPSLQSDGFALTYSIDCSPCNPATTAECGISRHNTNGFLCVCNGTAAGDLCDSTLLIFGPFERFNNESGRITSVNYPDASPNRIRSLYIVQILEARYIELEFEFFCTEKHKDRLYYGIGSPPPPYDLFGQNFLSGCPTDGTLPENIRLESDTIWLQYGTDPSLQSDGFALTYSIAICEADICNDSFAGDLTFSKTKNNETAYSTELCPTYTKEVGEPRAFRDCIGEFFTPGIWGGVKLNSCYKRASSEDDDQVLSEMYRFLEVNPVTNDNVTAVSRDLADITQTYTLKSDDLVILADILSMITSLNSSSPQVTRNVIHVVDNTLKSEEKNGDIDITSPDASLRILQSLEAQLTNLHQGGGDQLNFTEVRSSIAVLALTVDKDYFQENIKLTSESFITSVERDIHENPNDGQIQSTLDNLEATITLPTTLLNDSASDLGITFVVYRSNYLFKSRSALQMEQEIKSLVVAATIEGRKIANLESPVISRFQLLPNERSVTEKSRQCVFWDFSLADGFGDWSSEGCMLVSDPGENDDRVVECHCDHLTNFAVLVDIHGDIDNLVLDVLSIIGCVVSIIALLITLVTFLSMKKLRSKLPHQILINLSFALLGLYFSFLVGINRANLKIGCVIFGAFIHYFCLASVAWMCAEATIMYLLFVQVFNAKMKYFLAKASLAAWGLPLLVVVISVIVRHENYVGKYCFPQAGTLTFTISVVVFLVVMLCYNLIMFVLVIRRLTCGRMSKKEDEKRAERIKRVQNAVAISVLLGLGWVFGFLAIGGAQFIFNLLFLIFNTLQGLFVFVFFCMRNKDVGEMWREKLSVSRSESSRDRRLVSQKSDTARTTREISMISGNNP